MKPVLICVFTIISFSSTIDIKGRWETKPSEKGNITGVVFKTDNTYEGYINKKPFVSGLYSFSENDSVLNIQDDGCVGIGGVYKINFFADGDSMRFMAITDECTERKQGMQRLTMGRVKSNQ